jgi:hypothetical protein
LQTQPAIINYLRLRCEKSNNDSAITKKMTETEARKIILYFAAFQTDFSALSGWPAPRFWPTKVAAALERPQEDKIVKMTTLMAKV